ncbi:hypothetical protein FSP39_012423 [Pinctada imbricata]|uniref:TM2 domain-containing protein n=1 Tax=Pinctada imbricata TaxID=66713 RepID=A0AA88XR90_PINIB|nr:hypothetical protein FSP39_012423 [Pinctada imbricata]
MAKDGKPKVNPYQKRSLDDAFLLWATLGLFGAHHFYLHRYFFGVLYLLTLGLFFGGWLIDFFRMRELVKDSNEKMENPDLKDRKLASDAYALWFPFGIFGLHHAYIGNRDLAIVYACTLGMFFIGWLADLYFMSYHIDEARRKEEKSMFVSRRQEYLVVTAILCVSLLYIITQYTNITQVWNSALSYIQKIYQTHEFPINERLFCKPDDDILLLVAIYSGTKEGMERQFVRQKWGSYAKRNKRIRLLFFIGLTSNETDSNNIKRESKMYHDIIQINSTDTYRTLTLKSFAFFRWSQQFCKGAKYLLKIDCDMQIDLKRLFSVLERGNVFDAFQCGVILRNMHPFRTLGHKWFISRETYAKDVWPNYCYGPAYIVSNRIAAKIANLSIPKDPFPVDDVYMTGILREILKEEIRQDVLQFSPSHYIKTDTKVVNGNITTYIKPVIVKDIRNVDVKKKPVIVKGIRNVDVKQKPVVVNIRNVDVKQKPVTLKDIRNVAVKQKPIIMKDILNVSLKQTQKSIKDIRNMTAEQKSI